MRHSRLISLYTATVIPLLLLGASGPETQEERSALAALPAPTLTAPGNAATLTNFSPLLMWTNPPGTTQYHLQVIPANNDGPGVDVHIGSAGVSFQIPPPPQWFGVLPDMTYTWRVRVSDATTFVGLSDPSWSPWAERRFRTPLVSSDTVALAIPTNSAAVTTLTPTLQWANSWSAVFYYEVQLTKDPAFNTDPATAKAMVYSALIHGGVTTIANSYTVPSNVPLEPGTVYYWRVRPRVQGDGRPVAWTVPFSFRTSAQVTPFPQDGFSQRAVLAQYYAWYDEDTWNPQLVVDIPRTLYNSDAPVTIARHVAETRAAGVDALALSWLGPGSRTDANLQRLLAVAGNQGLWVTITFETDKPEFGAQEQVVAALQFLNRYTVRPNWLRYQGRPVLMFWRPSSVALSPGETPLDAWRALRDKVDPNRQAFWIMEGLDFGLLEVFDGQFGYSIAWSTDVRATLSSWARRVRAKAEELGQPKLFLGTAMPGYDDTRVRQPPEGFARDREGGAFFAQTWDAAIAAGSDWINITSFNEWIEGSQMEPSVTYGDLYLGISKEWSDRYKGASP